jgi:hypothetical protein
MRPKEAMMTAVVAAACILTATRPATAQPTAGDYVADPGYELIDMTLGDGVTPYPVGSESGFSYDSSVDSGVLMSTDPGWPQSYHLLDLEAVESAGFEPPGFIGTERYPAGGAPVPEPVSVAMLVAGLATLAVAARLRARRAG